MEKNIKSNIAYENIKQKILHFKYSPGDRINIREISREIGVSDIPIREALKKLESEGFIEFIQNRGARVMHFNADDFGEIYELRFELEALATQWATKHATEKDIDYLKQLTEEMDQCIEENNITKYGHLNTKFHNYLYSLCNSTILLETLNNLFARSVYSKSVFNLFPERLADSNQEHKDIISAIEDRDAELAAEIIRIQKRKGSARLVTVLKHLKS